MAASLTNLAPLFELRTRVIWVWKKRACGQGQTRIDEDELGAYDFGRASGGQVGCRSHNGCIGRATRLG